MQSQNSLDTLISMISNIDEKNNDKSNYEEDIAQKLDEHLVNNGEKLMSLPIQSLINIFKHPKRKLTNHDLAYKLINDYIEKKNDSNIYILFECLDGSKLSSDNLMDAFSSKDKRKGMLPSIDFSFVYEAILKVNSLEKKVENLNQAINRLTDSISTEVSEKLKQNKEEIKKINSTEIESFHQTVKIQINTLMSQFTKESEQNAIVISEKQNKNNEELIKKIDDQINEINKKFDSEISLLNKKNETENELLKKTIQLEISAKENDLNLIKTSLESQMNTIYNNNKNTMDSYKASLEYKLDAFNHKNENSISILQSKLESDFSLIKKNNENYTNEINSIRNSLLNDKSLAYSNNNQKIEDDISLIKKNHTDEISKLKQLFDDKILLIQNDISSMQKTLPNEIQKLREENKNEIDSIKNNLPNDILLAKINNNDSLSTIIENHTKEINSLNASINDHKNDINDMKDKQNEINSIKSELNTVKKETTFFKKNVELYSNEGILGKLKRMEIDQFDKLFIASQPSNDIYNLINPNTNDHFCSLDAKNNFIEFKLKDPVSINGITIYSHDTGYPKSFDIYIDNDRVYSVNYTDELKGDNKSMRINFSAKVGNKLKIIQTGQNWSGNYSFHIKRIEIWSSDSKYSGGVFKTLLDQSQDHDVHKCPLIISSPEFDHNSFHLIDSTQCVGTYFGSEQWFQVELTKGKAEIMAFRLVKRSRTTFVPKSDVFMKYKLKSFKIIGTDTFDENINSWNTLLVVNDQSEEDSNPLDIYNLPSRSAPVKYIRIILTGPSFEGHNKLLFFHFDFFGVYIN